MDLLGGYGSGSDEGASSDDGGVNHQVSAPAAGATTAAARPEPTADAPSNPGRGGGGADSASAADQPSTSSSLWSKLPKAAQAPGGVGTRRVVAFSLPLSRTLLQAADGAGSDEEEESATQRKKRLKAEGKTGRSKLMEYLPPPKHDDGADVGGVLGAGVPAKAKPALPHDFFGAAAPALPAGARGSDTAAGPSSAENEAYGVDTDAAHTSTLSGAQQHPSAAYAVDGGELAHVYQPQPQPQPAQQGPARRQVAPDEFELPAELAGVQFKEVSASKLRYVPPGQAADQGGLRAALGADYTNQLRAQAAGSKGSSQARRKHQIGTLYYNAKMAEVDILEGKSHGMKTKAETQAKYGW